MEVLVINVFTHFKIKKYNLYYMNNYLILLFILLLTLFIDYKENMTNNNQPNDNQANDNKVDIKDNINQSNDNQPNDNQSNDNQSNNIQAKDNNKHSNDNKSGNKSNNQTDGKQTIELIRENVIDYIKKHNLCSLEKESSGYLKTLTLKKTRDIHIDDIYANISAIVIYDKNGNIITNWFNETLLNFLEGTIISNSPLFIKDDNDAKPSSIMKEQLGVDFEMLKDYFIIKNSEFAGKDKKPLIVLKSNLDNDIYGYPKFPTTNSKNKFNGNYKFYGDLVINFRKENKIHLSDISKIRIIHSITTDNSKPSNHISGNIYLTDDAWKLSRYNLELTNYDNKVIISEPIGNSIVNYNQRNYDSSKRIMTEINIDS